MTAQLKWPADKVRETFLKFFEGIEGREHRRVPSSSLVPANDPTLLFINAGMNQFKDVFLGLEKRDYKRAVTSQKCVRAGGKHNDLENVGFTNRHHTFFEMLGNFSFGDYFKKEAIEWAWELVTSPDWYGIDKDKLWVTIFEGDSSTPRDDEAEEHWLDVGVPKDRILACGAKDNFWQMGATGPCGPCSELHYDMGVAASDAGHEDCKFPCECGRYLEIWNLVFMQFDRDASGKLTPLPKPSIDTGAGLERLTAVLQGKISNYDTDLFKPLFRRAEIVFNTVYDSVKPESASMRIIADHARAATFLISDGILPSNDGRGYVLRKIIRRAIRHGRLLKTSSHFLHHMVKIVLERMQNAYPGLIASGDRVVKAVNAEETRFAHTLATGLKKLDHLIDLTSHSYGDSAIENFAAQHNVPYDDGWGVFGSEILPEKDQRNRLDIAIEMFGENLANSFLNSSILQQKPIIDSAEAFKLYDTFGLPRDFIEDACRDQGLEFDGPGFDKAMEGQRERARASWKGAAKQAASPAYKKLSPTVFEGYTQTVSESCEVLAIVRDGKGVKELKAGEEGEVVLDHTPFYAESGGQVGDTGWLYDHGQNVALAEVRGCTSPIQGVRTHHVVAREKLAVGDHVDAVVDSGVRADTMRNHTATHLLHAALRETLGTHVKQAGSLVDQGHLRFDFSHFTDVADEELQDIEDLINRQVLNNTVVETVEDVPIDQAVNEYKAMALFGEKYGDRVRVVRIGEFSTELCGGTHVAHTGEIGLVKLISESSVAAGTRRVEAISGPASLKRFRERERTASQLIRVLQTEDSNLQEAAEALANKARQVGKELEEARTALALGQSGFLIESTKEVSGIKVVAAVIEGGGRGALRPLVDNLRQRMGSGVVVLGAIVDGKVALVVGVTKDLTKKLPAGKIIKEVAELVDAKGGGRPDLAEAGGGDPARLPPAIAQVAEIIEKML